MFKITTNMGAVLKSDTLKVLKARVEEESRLMQPGEFWNNIEQLVDGEWVEV